MKVMVIGSGGREHALVWKLKQSPLVEKIYAVPGNAGIGQLAECIPYGVEDLQRILQVAKDKAIDLTVVGPEIPLALGIVDLFQREGLKIFGPTKAAAQLEASKAFAKKMMFDSGVPTAAYEAFNSAEKARSFVKSKKPPFVIKADGLAAGKGVCIVQTVEEAFDVISRIMEDEIFGVSGKQIIIEEFLTGDELSILLFTDGTNVLPLASSQDHKRAFDMDEGPNTGGMGAYSPCPFVSEEEVNRLTELTARPVILHMRKCGIPYQGLLYVGLMMTAAGPRVLEYNVRFGDPETQAVLPRMRTDLCSVMLQVANGKLEVAQLEWDPRICLTVVMASGGYPDKYQKGFEIRGLRDAAAEGVCIFHAGTGLDASGKIVTQGGRVLNVSALGNSHREAYELAYRAVSNISFNNCFYRKDIGKRAFAKTYLR